jgi:hypothetical protein
VSAVAGSPADRWRTGITVLATLTGVVVCAVGGLAERRRRLRARHRHRELSRARGDPDDLDQAYPPRR